MSDEVTSTQSEIESVSESPSSTQSRSLTLTFSDSINVFLQEAHYEIDPSSVVDLIPISRTAIFSFLYSPPFGDGDRAGLVPLGVPCTTTDAVSGEVLAHPAMVEMSPTGAVIPSNWTVVVDKIGYYQVCAFQDVVKRWTLLEPARTVKVTPRLLGGITPESGIAGSFEFTIPVLGGSAADVVRLVPYGSSCRSDDASLYLSVSSVYDSTIVASGTIPLAGNYTACYRGFPQDIVPSEYVYGPIVVVGTASWYQVNTPPPIRVFKTLNVTVHGAGMTTSDAFTLSLDPSCSPSSSVGVNTPPQDGSTTGLSQLDVLLPLSRSGTVFLCYLSSAAYGNPYPLTPPIVVDAIYATGVTPFNETYASGTIVTLTFLGDLLSPENDRAELHVSGGGECDDPTPLRMRQSGGSFKVKVTAVTEYTVCYATNATGMTPISGASVRVVPRFYEPAEENLFFFGKIIRSEFVFRIIGYGLDPRRDVVWMQLEPPASNGTCSSSPPENALLPSNVSTDNDGVHHVQIPLSASGYHVLCYSQPSEGVLLTSIDVLGIQPAAPSSIVPTAGSASRRANVSFVGGEGLDLVTRDKAVVCSVGVVLEPTGPRSFFFTPPDVGYFELCFVSGVLTNGRTTTVTARVVPAFSAYPVIDAATFSSRVSQAATAVTLTLIGFGLTSSDNVYICGANESLPVLGNPDASFFSPTRVTLYQWSVVFAKAGTFQLCYTSQASPALAPQRVGEAVVIEPAISRLFPSRLYAGIESSVNFTGISLSTISSLYFVHASSSSGCAVTPSTSPIVTQRPQVDQIRATIPSRGTYSLCFTGISGTAFAAAESLTVVPTVLSMTATSPNQIYSGWSCRLRCCRRWS